MKIENGKKVSIEYELRVVGGDVIESSAQTGPVEYVHGAGRMLPALEARLEGLTAGDERTGVIPAKDAYGSEESLPTRELPLTDFPPGETPVVGKRFEASDTDGHAVGFVVVELNDQSATVRFLHPLAGKDISYTVKVLRVGDAVPKPPPIPVD